LCLVAVWFYYYYYSMPRTIFLSFNKYFHAFFYSLCLSFFDSIIFFSSLFCLTLEFYWCLLHRSLFDQRLKTRIKSQRRIFVKNWCH
jgi:hypothetical protein